KRPELFFQPQYAGGKEIGERRLDVTQLFHMRDKAAALDREDKIRGRFSVPALEEFRPLQRIMRAVDLDRVDVPAGVGQLVLMAKALWIKRAAPRRIPPTAKPYKDFSALIANWHVAIAHASAISWADCPLTFSGASC